MAYDKKKNSRNRQRQARNRQLTKKEFLQTPFHPDWDTIYKELNTNGIDNLHNLPTWITQQMNDVAYNPTAFVINDGSEYATWAINNDIQTKPSIFDTVNTTAEKEVAQTVETVEKEVAQKVENIQQGEIKTPYKNPDKIKAREARQKAAQVAEDTRIKAEQERIKNEPIIKAQKEKAAREKRMAKFENKIEKINNRPKVSLEDNAKQLIENKKLDDLHMEMEQ